MIASTVMVVGVLATVGTMRATSALGVSTRETTLAYQAARAKVEELKAQPFEFVLVRHNEDAADDPPGLASPGVGFDVPGLDPVAGDADGLVGRLLFPENAGGELREDANQPEFGLPADLDGDDVIGALDVTGTHILLPVRVRIEWTGQTGDRFMEFSTVLFRRE